MEKEFVSYEIAIALKELGFDEPCFGHWNYNNGKINYWYDEEIQNERTNKCILDSEKQFPKMNKNGCTAPTYSQAFRWFREKYKLHGNVETLSGNQTNWIIYDKYGEFVADSNGAGSYEEAELECLKKLIEIVKEKQ